MNPPGKFIKKIELTEEDVGSRVRYVPGHADDIYHRDCESGHIHSWNDRGVFVTYGRNTALTNFSDLVWE